MDCGEKSVSGEACYKLGCCYDALDSTCYYRLDGKNDICLLCMQVKMSPETSTQEELACFLM